MEIRIVPPRWARAYAELMALAAAWGVKVDVDRVARDIADDVKIEVV